jgi:hypothetical protein
MEKRNMLNLGVHRVARLYTDWDMPSRRLRWEYSIKMSCKAVTCDVYCIHLILNTVQWRALWSSAEGWEFIDRLNRFNFSLEGFDSKELLGYGDIDLSSVEWKILYVNYNIICVSRRSSKKKPMKVVRFVIRMFAAVVAPI